MVDMCSLSILNGVHTETVQGMDEFLSSSIQLDRSFQEEGPMPRHKIMEDKQLEPKGERRKHSKFQSTSL